MRLEGQAGRAFEPVEFYLGDRLSVQNWARALRSDEPAFLYLRDAQAAGWTGRPVPAVMFAFFLTLPTSALVDDLGFVWGRTLAAGIKAEVGRIAADDEWVRGQTFVDLAHEKPGKDGLVRQFLRLRTDFHDSEGRLVNRWQSLFIEKTEGPVTVPQRDEPDRDGLDAGWLAPRSVVPVVPGRADLPSRSLGPLDRLDFARMSISIDDPNLVHLDDAVAGKAGFDRALGSGGYVLGALYEVVRQWAGFDRIRSIDMRQLLPFAVGDELCATATVTRDTTVAGPASACAQATVCDGRARTIATATVTVQL